MANKKYVVKGIDSKKKKDPLDAYIMLRPDLGPNTHERVPELNDRVTRFDTYEEAKALADYRVLMFFNDYVIEEAEAVETTKTEEEGE